MKFKKIIAAISLAAVSGLCISGNLFGAAAEGSSGYSIEASEAIQGGGQTLSTQANLKDPNGDGVLDLYDIIYIEKFLIGKIYPTDVTRLDYSGNGIVSKLDEVMIAKYMADHRN